MRFRQIDHISLLEPGKKIEAQKRLTGDEDYLRDHFPRFAVMPGVLMLEALYQAATFLVRATDDHRPGLVLLRAAKNVKFADFVQPGQTLDITAEIVKRDGNQFVIKASGSKGDRVAVSGRLIVESCEPAEPTTVDLHASRFMRQMVEQLQQAAMV